MSDKSYIILGVVLLIIALGGAALAIKMIVRILFGVALVAAVLWVIRTLTKGNN